MDSSNNIPRNSYVLVTPVRNEEATIGITIESVVNQTILPQEWVIVSDGSTDKTDEIIKKYAAVHPFLRLLRLENRASRSFGSVVFAVNAGLAELKCRSYEYIGLLDGDVRFGSDYFLKLIGKFEENPKLGLGGGLALDVGSQGGGMQWLGDVAGAVQFFRRSCFESLGGLVALPEGGWDVITCVRARKAGYETRTFPDLPVDHLKPRNQGLGLGKLRTRWRMGIRDYDVGNCFLFEVAKCGYRCRERPLVVGGAIRLAGYISCLVRMRKPFLSSTDLEYIRQSQMGRVFNLRKSRPTRFDAKKS